MNDFTFMKKMNEEDAYLFKRCIRKMLDTTFIVADKDEKLYDFISSESNQYDVNTYLAAKDANIDIGGFIIHKHLCRETSKSFEMHCMGIEQLCDIRFSHCLRELTDNDMSRIGILMEEDLYNEVLKYMKENNVKLEQEIVSYYLVKDINYTIPPLY